MAAMLTFLGRLHPLIVHLPIGIVLLALLLQVLSTRPKQAGLKPAADLALGLGVLCAIASCCTGLLLSSSGDYDQGLVNTHQWLAIAFTVVTAILYGKINGRPATRMTKSLGAASLILVFLTGHFGGSLTHGAGYLTTDLEKKPGPPALKPVVDVQNSIVYTAMVQPVLHDNCYGCHSAGHSKGGLRLDNPEDIRKGGKDGAVVIAGDTAGSLLLKRILLPLDDDHHMAPKEKAQLTIAEVRLLKWWIVTGASFDKPAGQLPQDNDVHAMLAAFHEGTAGPTAASDAPTTVADSDMPARPIKPAPNDAVKRLRATGALVLPIAAGSNYIVVSFPADSMRRDVLTALAAVKNNVVELKCSDMPLGDELVTVAGGCPNLVRLWLDHTRVTGRGLSALQGLSQLRYLNLTGTAVDADGVRRLAGLKKLREVYLYQTQVQPSAWLALQAAFPHTRLDSGGYKLKVLTTDTAIVRPH